MGIGKTGKQFGGEVWEAVQKSMKGESLNGNKKVINDLFGGIQYAARAMDGGDFKGAFNKTFREGGEEAGKVDYSKIAMSYAGVAGTGRVLSGGGVYKDSNGNTNLAVVPFV